MTGKIHSFSYFIQAVNQDNKLLVVREINNIENIIVNIKISERTKLPKIKMEKTWNYFNLLL